MDKISKAELGSKPIYQRLSTFEMPGGFRGRSAVYVQLWWTVQSLIFGALPDVAYPIRSWILRAFGAKIGRSVKVRASARITYPWNLEIGDNTWVGHDTVIYNLAKISIGSDVAIAHKVYLCTGLHTLGLSTFPIDASSIIVEDQCWLANDSFVGPGVTIGRGSVIGARSTVFDSMPEGMICYGYPCRPVKPREVGI